MAILGRLLCMLGLLLCGAASPLPSAPHATTTKKPIIGKKVGWDQGPGPGVCAGRCPLPGVRWCVPPCKYPSTGCGTRAEPRHPLDRMPLSPHIQMTLKVGREEGAL